MSAKDRMEKYLESTKFASEALITLINKEEKELEQISKTLKENEEITNKLDNLMRETKNFDEFTYLRDQVTYQLIEEDNIAEELKATTENFKDKYESLSTLSGALLQIAKQGISIVYGDPNPIGQCKDGKKMKSQFLKTIIWEGRNQSIHYEEGFSSRFPSTKTCFEKLNTDYELKIERDGDDKINLAKEVVLIIGWKEYLDYERDMLSLV